MKDRLTKEITYWDHRANVLKEEELAGKVNARINSAKDRDRIEALAMAAVMEIERCLGREPRDVHQENRGYDIESSIPGTGRLLFIEVKGRAPGARTVTITKNEILTGLNKPDAFILAIAEVDGDTARMPRYIRRPFQREPDFGAESVNYDLAELLAKAEEPV